MTFPSAESVEPPPGLNGPQADAVAHADGPLLVFAGAGSGKTRVIVYRIANLLATYHVPPYRILSVTFTNKAAGEMKHRLAGLVGEDLTRDLWVGTFHSVCSRLLRRYHDAAGLSKNFVIYDDSDQRAVVGRVLKELNLDDKRYPVRQVLSRIHHEKQEGRGPEVFSKQGYFDDAVGECYARYEHHLKQANAVDFDDLLLHVLRIVEDSESLPGHDIRMRFDHVLVDEFQDVNQVQYRLVRAFTQETRNLCTVGDDDQSIYRWRGADVRVIRNFRRDYPDATIIKLEQNYRSTGNIVRSALGVIKPSTEREPKELWTSNKDGEPVLVVTADSEHDEAGYVVEYVRTLLERGTSARDIAVFYRVHAQSRVLEEVLRSERIPYQIVGGMRFFDRAEVKDVLSYLRVVSNPRSDVDLLRVINVPSRKIGQTTIDKLVAFADQARSSVFDAILPAVESGSLGTAAKKSLMQFWELLRALMGLAKTASPGEICEDVLDRTGYQKMLEQEDSAESDARILNVNELIQSIVDYEEEAAAADQPATLDGYLERVSLTSDADTLEDVPRVAMMTVHAAKGLEFDTVFITGMEEDLFPFRAMDPKRGDDIEEERRLAYVAVTRARRQLVITHASRRAIFGQTRYGIPSRFLTDFPKGSVLLTATPAAALMHDRLRPSSSGSGGFGRNLNAGSYGTGGSGGGGGGGGGGTGLGAGSRSPWAHPQGRAALEAAERFTAEGKAEKAERTVAERRSVEPDLEVGMRSVEFVAPQLILRGVEDDDEAEVPQKPLGSGQAATSMYVGRPSSKPEALRRPPRQQQSFMGSGRPGAGRNVGFAPAPLQRAAAGYGSQGGGVPAAVTAQPGERYVERDVDSSFGGRGMAIGGRVTHEVFGVGVVEAVDSGPDPSVTVRFSGHGKKRIKSRFLRFVEHD